MTLTLAEPQSEGTQTALAPVVAEIGWPESMPQLFESFAACRYPVFFDSARGDPALGRYSFLSAGPFETLRSRRGQMEVWDRDNQLIWAGAGDPLTMLAQRLHGTQFESVAELPPFQGGAAGLFSYDLCHHHEKLPRARTDEFAVPDLMVGLYDWVLSLDHQQRRAWILSTGAPYTGPRRVEHARAQMDRVRSLIPDNDGTRGRGGTGPKVFRGDGSRSSAARLDRHQVRLVAGHALPDTRAGVLSNFARTDYFRAVERAIDYIYAGDVYQVNLSQRLVAPLRESPAELYLRLRERNPSPFAGYFDFGDFVIASASPERFLKVRDREVETRPIKGTRPRWLQPEADMYSAGELRESQKDRAENVMIVDLLRNDLGRVCAYGSIRVTDSLRLESYQFVHHLVSEVRGRLRPEYGPVDLIRAAFPGGSVTGAPKIRAMEIIAELEPTVRGPYCGSLGYIGFDGSMDLNILIRTFTCGRGWIQFPVGGGIVAESSPEREYEETLHKAEGMLRALP